MPLRKFLCSFKRRMLLILRMLQSWQIHILCYTEVPQRDIRRLHVMSRRFAKMQDLSKF